MVSKEKESGRRKMNEVNIAYEGDDGLVVTESTRTQFTLSSNDDTTSSHDDKTEQEREIFEKAREYLNPGWLFRLFVQLYAERKLVVFFWLHFFSTIVIWVHFALIKFQEQAETVPEGAHRYWLKRLAPPLEFGSMHAILFQMSLLPITMSRFSIASLTESFVDRLVPLNRVLRMHIHLGYTMIIIVFFATCFFFFFFGLLCAEGEEAFCEKFTTEIMSTGYAILGLMLIIGGTSYFRHRIPYEIFYAVHHLVFIMYFVTIAHTIDREQRQGNKERSQTFKWFSSTLLYYFCDRAAMHLNHRFESRLLASSTVSGSTGSKMVILKLRRPVLFRFKPGQYAFLNCPMVDSSWHPFSIASCPESSQLEFYIEVYDGNTWTKKLWNILDQASGDEGSSLLMTFQVMGPYGTSIAKTKDFSHILAVGAGTGIVPILSLYKQHIQNMLRLEPGKFFHEMEENEMKIRQIENAMEPRKGSLVKKAFGGCLNKDEYEVTNRREEIRTSIHQSIEIHDMLTKPAQRINMKEMKKAASQATQTIYGVVLLTSLPVFGMTVFALTVSWNTIPIDLYPRMVEILKILTMVFQAVFLIVACFIWHANNLLSYIDIVMCIISPFADLYYMQICNEYGTLRPVDILTYSILTLYMVFRLWAKAVMPRGSSSVRSIVRSGGTTVVDQLNFVWTTRSASLVSEILPDILSLWEVLASKWGPENANHVCPLSIYVTDPDKDACDKLRREYEQSDLYQSGGIRFGRADLSKVIESHSLDLVATRRNSQSLLAFCGSPQLASEIHGCKISNDMVLAITGNKQHHMDFVSESYGGVKPSKKANGKVKKHQGVSQQAPDSPTNSKCKDMKPLTTRKEMAYTGLSGRIITKNGGSIKKSTLSRRHQNHTKGS